MVDRVPIISINCIRSLYQPQQGQIVFYDGQCEQVLTRKKAHAIAQLRVAHSFQNIELFRHMTVLENIMLGRHMYLKSSIVRGGLYWWGGAQAEEIEKWE